MRVCVCVKSRYNCVSTARARMETPDFLTNFESFQFEKGQPRPNLMDRRWGGGGGLENGLWYSIRVNEKMVV